MFFQVYGENAFYQFLGWILVFLGLILANEFARRTLEGGLITFLLVPILVTVYLFIINICADFGFS